MAKAGKAEVERRVDELYELVVTRIGYRQIVNYCQVKWGIGERQVAVYIAKVRERMAALCREEQSAELAQALAGYEAIFAHQMAASHYGGARETLDSIVRLRGLAAAQRAELAGDQTLKVIVEYADEGEA
jgi:hypothetical protein